MRSLTYFAAICLFAAAQAFTWEDCGTDPERPIKFSYLELSPSPLKGNADNFASFDATIARDLPTFKMEMSLKKKVLFVKIPAPCINGLGSCTFNNICDVMWGEEACPADVKASGIPCSCPFKKGVLRTERVKFFIPDFGRLIAALASGEYHFHAEIKDINTDKQLGCLKAVVQLKA